jgi:molybdopterin synthase catalytic subunit
MSAPAFHWKKLVYSNANFKNIGEVLGTAYDVMTQSGFTNVQQQAEDVFAVTANMIITIAVVKTSHDYAVVVMVAGSSKSEVTTTLTNVFNNLKNNNPF